MTWGGQNTQSDAFEQLDFALEQGVNFVDTAELYAIPPSKETYGKTETIIGNWLAKNKKRDSIILASKVAGNSKGWIDHIRQGPKLNRQQMTEALDGSLKRLQTNYLDLYQIHWPARVNDIFGVRGISKINNEQVESIEAILEVLNDFVKSGKVREIGISNETPWGLMQYLKQAKNHDWAKIQSIQNPYSLLNRLFEVGLSEASLRENVGLLVYSPLGFGVLSGKYLNGKLPNKSRLQLFPHYQRYSNENAVKATQAYADIAAKYGLSLAQMALSFVNSREFVTANIIGATTMEQLKENVASISIHLSDEVLDEIEAVHATIPDPAP